MVGFLEEEIKPVDVNKNLPLFFIGSLIIIILLLFFTFSQKNLLFIRQQEAFPVDSLQSNPSPDVFSGKIVEMPLQEKIGYLVMGVPYGKELSEKDIERLNEDTASSYFLLSKNLDSSKQLDNLIATASGLRSDFLIAVDQEGGKVSRIPWIDSTSQAEIANETEAYKIAKTRGEELKSLGISVNFSPVLDQTWQSNSFIGRQKRFFKGNVGKLGAAMIRGYLDAEIIPVAKHFPGGLGRTSQDPHLDLPSISITREELDRDLEPFKKAIEANVPAIMATHLIYPEFDQVPVSQSKKFLTDILRSELGFEGVIVVDDLSMGAVKNHYQVGEYAVESILAGGDLLLVTSGKDYQEIMQSLTEAVKSGELPERRIDQSLKRRRSLN